MICSFFTSKFSNHGFNSVALNFLPLYTLITLSYEKALSHFIYPKRVSIFCFQNLTTHDLIIYIFTYSISKRRSGKKKNTMALGFRSIAIFIVVAFSASFESTRTSLHTLGDVIGGVGGVGGLTGQYAPHPKCNQTAAYINQYCFNSGVFAGLTPYAIITTLFWVSPLFLLALGGIAEGLKGAEEEPLVTAPCNETANSTEVIPKEKEVLSSEESERNLSTFNFVWYLLNFIWFVNPFCAFMSSPFYQQSPSGVILAFALSAAYPLSWCAMLVSLPMNSTTGAVSLLGLEKNHLREAHIMMAYWVGFWVLTHGLGELTYLAATKVLWSSLSVQEDGENLIYVFGLITLVFGMMHGLVAVLRSRWYSFFRKVHLPLALFLLLTATIHWWPFAFFLLPAITTHAVELAKKLTRTAAQRATRLCMSIALLSAISGSLCALCIVWSVRAAYMLSPDANRYIPFLFAGASFVFTFLGALGSACAVFAYSNRMEKVKSSDEDVQMC